MIGVYSDFSRGAVAEVECQGQRLWPLKAKCPPTCVHCPPAEPNMSEQISEAVKKTVHPQSSESLKTIKFHLT